MEEQGAPHQTPLPTQLSGKNWYKILFFGFVAIVLVAALVFVGWQLGQQKKTPSERTTNASPSTTKQLSPTETAEAVDNGIPITENTVSYAYIDNEIILQYKGKTYRPGTDAEDPREASIPTSAQTWIGLVDAPTKDDGFNELFSLEKAVYVPQGTVPKFLFVVRLDIDTYKVYYYDTVAKQLKDFTSSIIDPKETANVPKIGWMSMDNNYASLNMFECWNCGGHKPATLLLNLQTGAVKRIGKTSYFNWKEKGNYEYKEYITKTCPTLPPGQEGMQLECAEDPGSLPLKTGQM